MANGYNNGLLTIMFTKEEKEQKTKTSGLQGTVMMPLGQAFIFINKVELDRKLLVYLAIFPHNYPCLKIHIYLEEGGNQNSFLGSSKEQSFIIGVICFLFINRRIKWSGINSRFKTLGSLVPEFNSHKYIYIHTTYSSNLSFIN